MKCLSLTQPWATLVAIGVKRYETRTWWTKYRGPLAIHAAKSFPAYTARNLCEREPFRSALEAVDVTNSRQLPLGAIIAVGKLINIQRIWMQRDGTLLGRPVPLSAQEEAFGDYTQGRYAWILSDVRAIKPVPFPGRLGLFEVPDKLLGGVV